MARPAVGIPATVLKDYAIYLLKKIGCLALMWVAVFFISQWLAEGIGALFGMSLGAVAGLIIGWVLAEDAVERSSMTGLPLWTTLVICSWLTIGITEMVMKFFTGWEMTFGRWMLITAAMLLAMASTVWRASADD